MYDARFLNGQLDLRIRNAERLQRGWQCCGDVIDRHSGKPIGRVYGTGSSKAAAEEEVMREGERWARRMLPTR